MPGRGGREVAGKKEGGSSKNLEMRGGGGEVTKIRNIGI